MNLYRSTCIIHAESPVRFKSWQARMNTGGRRAWDMLYVPLTGSLAGVHHADAGSLGLQSWGQISTQQVLVWWTLADAVKGSGH